MLRDVAAAVLLLAGSALTLIAGIGLHRFASVFARMHAATKATTLGVVLMTVGAALRLDSRAGQTTLLLAAGLQLITTPISAHLVARAAFRGGTEMSPHTVVEDLDGDPARYE